MSRKTQKCNSQGLSMSDGESRVSHSLALQSSGRQAQELLHCPGGPSYSHRNSLTAIVHVINAQTVNPINCGPI